jgi:hypothetical protein
VDYQFEKRICESAKAILVSAGFPLSEVHVSGIGSPGTARDKLTTPRVEVRFLYGGESDEQRKRLPSDSANDGALQRTYYSRHEGRLVIRYITDRDWNASSHSTFLNSGRLALLFCTDAQWERLDGDGIKQGYELHKLKPAGCDYAMDSSSKHDITDESYDIVFDGPQAVFTPTA